MTSIRRTVTVLRAFWQLNWLEELQYRGNFIASLLGTVFWLAMAVLTVALYFRHAGARRMGILGRRRASRSVLGSS